MAFFIKEVLSKIKTLIGKIATLAKNSLSNCSNIAISHYKVMNINKKQSIRMITTGALLVMAAVSLMTLEINGHAVKKNNSDSQREEARITENKGYDRDINHQEETEVIPGGKDRPRTEVASRGYQAGRDEIQLMAKVIEGEAADESFEGKVAVGAVILNRLESNEFPDTIRGVIYQRHAFEAVLNGQYNRPLTQDSVNAANMALEGWDPTHEALYYWNPYKKVNPWVWSRPIVTQIGNHVFAH